LEEKGGEEKRGVLRLKAVLTKQRREEPVKIM
jgi:hypothetical protein